MCRSNKSPWVCLTCSSVHCGRWVSSVGVEVIQPDLCLLAWPRQFVQEVPKCLCSLKEALHGFVGCCVLTPNMFLCYLLRVWRMYPVQLLSKRGLSAGCDRSAQSLGAWLAACLQLGTGTCALGGPAMSSHYSTKVSGEQLMLWAVVRFHSRWKPSNPSWAQLRQKVP